MHAKIVFLAILFLVTTGIGAQNMDSLVPPVNDTMVNKVEQRVERNIPDNGSNNDFGPLLEIQKQNEKREKKGAIIRIGIGVGMLVILIIGLMRRKKKKLD